MQGEVERSAGSFLCCLLPEDASTALGMSQHYKSLSFAKAEPQQLCHTHPAWPLPPRAAAEPRRRHEAPSWGHSVKLGSTALVVPSAPCPLTGRPALDVLCQRHLCGWHHRRFLHGTRWVWGWWEKGTVGWEWGPHGSRKQWGLQVLVYHAAPHERDPTTSPSSPMDPQGTLHLLLLVPAPGPRREKALAAFSRPLRRSHPLPSHCDW